jgi:oligopeptidase B
LFSLAIAAKGLPQPPKAERIPKELTIHGHLRMDDYYWLNQRENPKTIAYLEAENAYTDLMTRHLQPFSEKLYTEMISRLKQDDTTVPVFDRGYWYYNRYEAGKDYKILCRKKMSLAAKEEIMLNGNHLAAGKKYFALGTTAVSMDNRLLAYTVDVVSRRKYTLRFRNLKTGMDLADEIYPVSNEVVWANDNRTVFYLVMDDTLRSFKVMRHVLGQKPSRDQLVFEEKENTYTVSMKRSRSDKYIFISSISTLSTEFQMIDADQPRQAPKLFLSRQRELKYYVDHFKDYFYILTNYQAKNFQIMQAEIGKTDLTDWKTYLPHRPDVLVLNFSLFAEFILIDERESGLSQLRVLPWDDQIGWLVPVSEKSSSISSANNPDPALSSFHYQYSSLTTPDSTYEYDFSTRQSKLLKQEEVLGGFKSEDYISERITAHAYDGVKIPMSLVYKKSINPRKNNPLLLYGYGAYGYTLDPDFKSAIFSLLDRGMIFALAHIRGGQEYGRQWYEDGKLMKKINTFTDFIACGEHLVRYGYTSPEKLAASGGSAGGLLIGAVINLQPDLFKVVSAGVPFVDVITTMLDDSIPLTSLEFDEWGNPQQFDAYDYMLSYSPYDNVRPKHYPAMLVTTGLHDSQVQYFEPAKWVAKLRVNKLDQHPLLLKTNMHAGHGGASGRFNYYRELAFDYAFILSQLGIHE